jgi:hypothetical protein
MLDSIKNFFKQLQQPEHHNNLEAYIVSHNPQTIHDVDRLEQEFDRLQSRFHFFGSYQPD